MTRDLIGYGKEVPRITWPNKARIAVSLVAHFEEGAERNASEGDGDGEGGTEGLGPNTETRDLSVAPRYEHVVASFFEYGPRRGFWRLTEIFDRHGVPVTFFCSGRALERNPLVAKEIIDRGHEICGHGYRWIPYPQLSLEEERKDIQTAVRAFEKTTGQRPLGWNSRVPSPRTRELLVEEGGFMYDSDSYDDDLPYFAKVNGKKLLTLPFTLDVTDEKYWALQGFSGFTRPDSFFIVMKRAFDQLYAEGATHPKMMSVSLHLRIAGRPTRAKQVDRFIQYAKGFPGVWFARRIDIARWWMEHYSHL